MKIVVIITKIIFYLLLFVFYPHHVVVLSIRHPYEVLAIFYLINVNSRKTSVLIPKFKKKID